MSLSISDKKKINEEIIMPLFQEVQAHVESKEDDQNIIKKAEIISSVLRIAHWITQRDKALSVRPQNTHANTIAMVNQQAGLGRVINSEITINFLEFYTSLDGKIQNLFPQATNAEVQTYIRIQLFKAIDPFPHFMQLQKQYLAIAANQNIQVGEKSEVEALPVDLLKSVFSFLSLVDCMTCYATSREFHHTVLEILNQKATEVCYVLGNIFTHSNVNHYSYGCYFRKEISDEELRQAFVYHNPDGEDKCNQESPDDRFEQGTEGEVFLFDDLYTTLEYLNYLSESHHLTAGYALEIKQYAILAVMHKHMSLKQLNWKNKEIEVYKGSSSSEYNPGSRTLDMRFSSVKKNDLLPFKGIATVEASFGIFKTYGFFDKTKQPEGIIDNATENRSRTCTIL